MKSFYDRTKSHASSLAFVAGFIWDSLMLSRIDHAFARTMLTVYLVLAGISIVAINMHEIRRTKGQQPFRYGQFLPLILQFCFGSLFSAYIVFYTQSASLAVNWPFLIFLILLVVGNEFYRARYLSPTFHLCVFFIVLFSYNIFTLPILLGRMGGDVFVLSGFLTLGIMILLRLILRFVAPEITVRSRLPLVAGVALIYALFNLAYWSNLIPPVPLSLKEIGVYHSVKRLDDGAYSLTFEPSRWYPFFKDTSETYRRLDTSPVYVWSSVFAPTKLTVPIFYTWSYFDEIDKVWVTTDRVEFPLVGGREDGYRGYSLKSGVFPARWRVDVETARHERVGREEFEIVATTTTANSLVTETR